MTKKKQHNQESQASEEKQRVDVAHDDESSEQAVEIPDEVEEIIRSLEQERDEASNAHKRALADFQNYQRRAIENERRAEAEGATRIVRNLLPVIDHFDLAINQSAKDLSVEQLLGGVKIVRDELKKALQASGVERIDPQRGEAFDPNMHEAMMREPTDDLEPNSVVSVLQSGYRMGEQVLRPAKVSVAISPEEADQPGNEQSDFEARNRA